MGWYHVNKIGKGICLGNVDEIHYNEDFIATLLLVQGQFDSMHSKHRTFY